MNALIENAKNVIFDVGRVLLGFEPQIFMPKMLPGIANERLNRSHIFDNRLWIKLDEGVVTVDDIANLACELTGDPALYDAAMFAIRHFPAYMDVLPPAKLIPTLREQGKKLYVLSNYGVDTFRWTQEQFPEVFADMDGMIVSAHEKMVKPDPRIYELLLSRFDLKAEECVFIDDRLENVEAARKLGIKGIHYTGPEVL